MLTICHNDVGAEVIAEMIKSGQTMAERTTGQPGNQEDPSNEPATHDIAEEVPPEQPVPLDKQAPDENKAAESSTAIEPEAKEKPK